METLSNTQIETKRAYIMPKSVKAIIKANEAYKNDNFSLSGLVRYCQNEKGQKIIETYCHSINLDFSPKQITVKFITENNKQKKFINKDGSKKMLFTFWVVLSAIRTFSKTDKAKKLA